MAERCADFKGWIGVARRDITPPAGIYSRNWGAAEHDVAEGVHRPITLTLLAVSQAQDAEPLVLASVDFGGLKTPPNDLALRGLLLDRLGLEADRVMVSSTHTHAGPSTSLDDVELPGGHLIRGYLNDVAERLADAGQEAVRSAVPATLRWRYGRCDLATNRDWAHPEQPERLLVGYNPDAPPADDTLLVGRVTRDADGATLASLVNYACHPTTLAWENRLISPDYVGAMREVVESATGGAPCLFLQGASGELAPAEQYTGDVEVADRHGRHLGHAALACLAAMGPAASRLTFVEARESGAPLAVWRSLPAEASHTLAAWSVDVDLPLKPLPSEAELQAKLDACSDRVMAERMRRKLRQIRHLGSGPTCPMPLWIWRIGGATLLGQPNETYSVFQQTLRQQLAPNPVVVMNLVNGSCGYLPPADRCDDRLYAYWQSPFASGGLETLMERASAEVEAQAADGVA